MKKNHLSRRAFFARSGGLALGSLLPLPVWAASSGKRIILIQADGGWDTTFCLNPRLSTSSLDGPDQFASGEGEDIEEIVDYGNGGADKLKIMANDARRPSVSAFFNILAPNAIIVNGIYTASLVHQACRFRMLTGTRSNESPDVGMIGGLQGAVDFAVPYLDLGGAGLFGAYAAMTLQLGRSNQIIAHLDRDHQLPGPTANVFYPTFHPDEGQQSAIDAFLRQRENRLIGKGFSDSRSVRRIADYGEARARAERILLEAESSGFLEQMESGLKTQFGDQVELAVSLMASGLCHSVGLDSGASWDSHDQLSEQNSLYQELFFGLGRLVVALQKEPAIWQDTMVVVLSEMTRKPRLNEGGGKDHWPSTSALVFGGGISGGRTLGASDEGLNAAGVNLASGAPDSDKGLLNYDSFVAGLIHAAGQDPEEWLPGVEVLHGIVD
jgi:hypothetical protein